ncbi:hypothetical protein ONS95_004409 [Cadophora gregata]|uniref:uncharacterized protein n=1 Tax=Cadophora gregata TaxID=51156 RepID=UPI0026DDA4E9|nr:uncharacterized protein ONS95_004409 [Cadophora gregata]KAK0105196.1 hypothetical protein ONS96_004597 [Cadophora gregata f. sp. sojae]KAK0105896.1 hypothetical protein ONS95_004409 [Cadophora gregata]
MSNSPSSLHLGAQSEKIKCDYGSGACNRLFNRREDMERHKSEFHEDPKKCPWCGYSAKRDQRLWNHLYEEHKARSYRQSKCRCHRKSKGSAKQQRLQRDEQPQGADADSSSVDMDHDDLTNAVYPLNSDNHEEITKTGDWSLFLNTEFQNNMQHGQDSAGSFIQPSSIQQTSDVETLQQNQIWTSPVNTPFGSTEHQNTFGYIPTSRGSHGVGATSHPQGPPVVSNQLRNRQIDFSLSPVRQSEAFPAPIHDQQQQFEQSALGISMFSQPNYSQNSMVYQTPVNTTKEFGQAGSVDPAIQGSSLQQPMSGAVDIAATAWGGHTTSSLTIDHFTSSTSDYFPGNSENDRNPMHLNEFGGWNIDDD